MDSSRLLGIAIFVLGLVALGVAYNASDAPMEHLSSTLTGRYSDATTAYFAAGPISIVIGCYLVLVGRHR